MARHRNSVSCMHRREDGPRRRGRAAFMQRLAKTSAAVCLQLERWSVTNFEKNQIGAA